jgi:CRISPR type I-E-associated protein CasB/Cse2
MNTQEDKTNDPLIEKLLKLLDDRGSLSHLRRFWSPSTLHYAYPILGRLGVPDPARPDAITAALFAVHPSHHLGGPSIGRAALSLGERKENHHPYDSHMRRLLACGSLEDVGQQLLKLMRRLNREAKPIDYNRVMWDLRNWDKKSSDVKTRWAMDFWQAPADLQTPGEA